MPKFSITVKFQGYEFMAQQFSPIKCFIAEFITGNVLLSREDKINGDFKHAMDQIRS